MSIAPRVGIYCDLGISQGSGHFVRCSALAYALHQAGADVTIAANFVEVPWTRNAAAAAFATTIQAAKPSKMSEFARLHRWDIAVIDSYLAIPADLTDVAIPLVAIDDDARRPLSANAVINQNLNADECDYRPWGSPTVLRGPDYALLRPQFARNRPESPVSRPRSPEGRRKILVMLGGTDANGAAVRITTNLLQQMSNVDLTTIAANPQIQAELDALPAPPGATIQTTGPVPDIERLMLGADLVITAAGSTIWELCCLGMPMALIWVAENQRPNYDAMVAGHRAIGLGILEQAITPGYEAWRQLAHTDLDTELSAYANRAWHLVDGQGSSRAAKALLATVEPL